MPTGEFLLPKTLKMVDELMATNRLSGSHWAKLDDVLLLLLVEQSTRQLSGKPARQRHKMRVAKAGDQQKHEAYVLVQAAMRKGTLFKPKTCESCNKQVINKGHLHAHHEDYSRPLAVIWLCRTCHSRLHATGVTTVRVLGAAEA